MKREFAIALSVAAVSVFLIFSPMSRAANIQKTQISQSSNAAVAGTHEAKLMVPARAYLLRDLYAKKDRAGEKFQAKLSQTILLKNGTKLPNGTRLIGVVSHDDMHLHAKSKLALRFTKAELKNGKMIPIKATIVGVVAPESSSASGYPVAPGDQQPNSWTPQTLQVDQIGALHHVDLHSRISSKNSGVFVSRQNDNMKLQEGSELELAIAGQLKS